MSQFPQQPYGQHPQQQQQPMPPGYPAPGYGAPAYGQPGMMMPTSRTSAAAIASLITGILGCVPLITSLVAVICGIVGIRATRDPNVRGRGMAIAGLILGIIGLILWPLMGAGVASLYITSRPQVAMAEQFTKDVAAGKVQAAMTNVDASSLPQADVQTLADQMKTWGTFNGFTFPGRSVVTLNGKKKWMLVGVAEFSSAQRTAEFELTKQLDGTYKISRATFK